MRKKIHKRKVLKKWVRMTIFAILCIICLFAIYLIYYSFNSNKTNNYKFKYDISNNADYRIYLNDNSINDKEYIEMNQPAIASDIDYIDIRYNYNFKGSRDSKVNYLYNIVGTLFIEYENANYGKQVIDTIDYVLVNDKKGVFEKTSGFGLSDSVKINYDQYAQIVKKYIMEKGINVTAYLQLKMNVKIDGNLEGEDYTYDDAIKLNIPLSEKVIMISSDYKENDSKVIDETVNNDINILPFVIGSVTLTTSLILLIYLCKNVIFISTKSRYRKQIDKIFKEYSEILVEVSSSVEYEDYTFVDIKEFEDMIDLEEEYKSPILYYEKVEGYESWFVVIKDNFMYRYILKAD